MSGSGDAVWVEAPARLHLGLLDLRGDLGRRFGGMGVAIRTPSLLLEARLARDLSATGPDAARVLRYARRFLAHHHLAAGAELHVHRAIPAHAGLGSGTQVALSTARALAELYHLPTTADQLARVVGRARRSAIGTWAFQEGGFLLEGGRRMDRDAPAPLLLRHPLPERWRCVLAIPDSAPGLSGPAEDAAFREMSRPSAELVGRISHLTLMLLLPALVEGDLAGFGRAVTEIQRLVGETFRSAQGGTFAHPEAAGLIQAMLDGGAAGAGQSSWGPTVYGFVEGDAAAESLCRHLRTVCGSSDVVQVAPLDNQGARCWRGAAGMPTPRPRTGAPSGPG